MGTDRPDVLREEKGEQRGELEEDVAGETLSRPEAVRAREKVQPSRKEQFFEVSVFLFLIVPSMTFSFFMGGQAGGENFVILAFATIFRDLALVSLILFFTWRNREPTNSLGWRSKNLDKELAVGVGLFVPMFLLAAVIENLLRSAGFSSPSAPTTLISSRGPLQTVLAFILVVVVAFSEETIFRGYLILRLKAITSSPLTAAVLSAGFFTLGHGYEGTAGALTVGVLGLVFAAVYLWRKSLVAPMVMHFLQDFIGIVLVPLLGSG